MPTWHPAIATAAGTSAALLGVIKLVQISLASSGNGRRLGATASSTEGFFALASTADEPAFGKA